jgi:hypothetical protein
MKSVSNLFLDSKDTPQNSGASNSSACVNRLFRRDLFKVNLPNFSFWALIFATIFITRFGYIYISLATLVAYAIFGFLGFALVWCLGGKSIRIFAIVYGTATVAAVVLAEIFTASYGVPYMEGGSDELHFEEVGVKFSQNYGILNYGDIRGNLVDQWHNSIGYIYLIGLLAKFSAWFGGFHTMVPRLFNAACLGILSVLVYQTGLRLRLQNRTAVAAALFAGCLPLMVWVSVQTLRDLLQSLLIMSLVNIWLPNQNNRWRFSLPVLISLSFLLMMPIWEMRKPQALVALIFIAFAIMSNRRSFKPLQFILLTLPIAVAAAYLIAMFYTLLHTDILDLIDSIDSYAEMRGEGGTGGGLSSIIFESSLFPIGWLYRIAYALATPLPVEFLPIDKAWLSIGTVVHFMFLPFLLIGLRKAIGYPAWRLIVVAFILLFIGMAMFTFTARHITQYLPLAILLTALGFESHRGDLQKIFLTTGIIGGCLGLTYIVLKI